MKTLTFTLLFALLSSTVFATQDKSTLELRLQSVNTGYLDGTTIYFDRDILPVYNSSEDAAKIFNDVPGVPALFSYTSDGVKCSINGAGDLTATATVTLGTQVDVSGMYKITAINLDNFDATSIILLEDKQSGTITDLRTNFTQVQLDSGDIVSGRFAIHISYPASFASVNSGCNNNDGIIKVQYDSSIQWDNIQITDVNNNPVSGGIMVNKGETDFGSLPEGNYTVNFIYGSYSATRSFFLNGEHVVANIGTTAQTIYTGQQVTFNANATDANQYLWDFGDGTVITGVSNPSLAYNQSGTYTIVLKCSNNYGCSTTTQLSITVDIATGVQDKSIKDISVYAHAMDVTVNMNDVTNSNTELYVYNLLGAAVYTSQLHTQKETISLGSQPTGYYLVSVRNAGEINTSRVFLSK